MNEGTASVQRSILSAHGLVQQVLPRYDLPTPITCDFWNHSINDTYIVQAGESKYMLRISPTDWRSMDQLGAEIDLLHFLHRHHFSVPQPIALQDGTYIQSVNAPEGIRYAVLFTFVPGVPSDSMTETRSSRYGNAVAEFHLLTNDYPTGQAGFRFDLIDTLDEPLARLEPLFREHQGDYNYLQDISIKLKEAADKLSHSAPTYGICHGDLNASNFLLDGEGGSSLVDLEYFGYGWRVFDIATFFNTQLIDRGRTDNTKRILEAFIAGYQERRPMNQPELESLPAFVLLRQIWLLGISAKYIPKSTVGLDLYQRWMFQQVMPFIREWVEEPWQVP